MRDNIDKDNYNPPTDNSTYQQDDDDYEALILKYFDLALRKFITSVNDTLRQWWQDEKQSVEQFVLKTICADRLGKTVF